jgi:hypothetical protein
MLQRLARLGAKVPFRRIVREMVAEGGISLKGARVDSVDELAIRCQALRNPIYEVYRIFYCREGRVVAVEAYTLKLLFNTTLWVTARDPTHTGTHFDKIHRRRETKATIINRPHSFQKETV